MQEHGDRFRPGVLGRWLPEEVPASRQCASPRAIREQAEVAKTPEAALRFLDALDVYAISGRGDVKRLVGREGFRLRVGRYRIVFDEDQTRILAIYVGKRETTTY